MSVHWESMGQRVHDMTFPTTHILTTKWPVAIHTLETVTKANAMNPVVLCHCPVHFHVTTEDHNRQTRGDIRQTHIIT